MTMKKKSKLIRLGVVFAFCCAVVALLEAFDLHPQFSIGKFHSVWNGVRRMDLVSGTMTLPGGTKVIQRDFDIGPVKIAIEYD